MCRVRLERFGEGNIYPHEETHGAAKADRLKLWRACKANLSQIFGLFPDPENEAQSILETAIRRRRPARSDRSPRRHPPHLAGDRHVNAITAVIGAMGDRPVYIADGHHRYETACNLRDQLAAELAQRGEHMPPEHPANYVLMMFVSMSDPGMLVLATHRLFRGLPPMTSAQLRERLGDCFRNGTRRQRTRPSPLALGRNRNRRRPGDARLLHGRRQRVDDRPPDRRRPTSEWPKSPRDHSADWQGLGVSILHRLVMDTLLDRSSKLPAPKYVRDIEEVVRGLKEGDAAGRDATGQAGTGGRFELAALVMPATVEHIRAISSHGERMPAKSTYFYPKLLSGLVINPLE